MKKGSKYDFNRLSPLLQKLWQRKGHLAEKSRIMYLRHLFDIKKTLEEIRNEPDFSLEDLTRDDVMDYFDVVVKRDISDNYVYLIGVIVRKFSEFLYEEDLMNEKEFKKIKIYLKDIRPEKGEVTKREAMPDDDLEIVFKRALNELYRMVFWTCLNYGIRPIELGKLIVEDVMLEKDPPVLRITKSKRKKWRYIPITPGQMPVWESWFEARKNYGVGHDMVFFNTKLAKLNSLGHIFKKISEASELHIYPYKLRYTYAVKLWRHGVNILIISKMLGHDSIDTTMRYLRVEEQEIREKYLAQTKGLF